MTSGGELPDDFFYDLKSFERETPTSELPSSFAAPYHSFAFESAKRSNLHYLDEGATLLYAAGDSPPPPPAPRRMRISAHAHHPAALTASAHRRAPRGTAVLTFTRHRRAPRPAPQATICTSSTWRR